MNRKRMCLVIAGLLLQMSLFASCQATVQPTTIIPDQNLSTEAPQVTLTEEILPTSDGPTAWSENFEDGNLDGWDTWNADGGFLLKTVY